MHLGTKLEKLGIFNNDKSIIKNVKKKIIIIKKLKKKTMATNGAPGSITALWHIREAAEELMAVY